MREVLVIARRCGAWFCLVAVLLLGAAALSHDVLVHHDSPDSHCDACLQARHGAAVVSTAPAGLTVQSMGAAPLPAAVHPGAVRVPGFASRAPPALQS